MSLVYRSDDDLEFLKEATNDQLDPLVLILTRDRDGDARLQEDLTSEERYRSHTPNHTEYWDLIVAELQTFGGNTFSNLYRGGGDKKGVLYREILFDVCDRMKVNYNRKSPTEMVEQNLLAKILVDSVEKMTPEQLQELVRETGLRLLAANITPSAVAAALQYAVRTSGFVPYKLAVVVANAAVWPFVKALGVGGLSLAANATLTRTIGVLAGPVGLALTAIWTAYDLAGPAYWITMPAVLWIACLRSQHMQPDRTSVEPPPSVGGRAGETLALPSSTPLIGNRR